MASKTNKTKDYRLNVVNVRLVKEPALYSDKKITCSQDVIDLMKDTLKEYDREVFCIINLKADGSVINMNVVSMGTLNASLVSPREVFKSSILSNAASFIAFHNHPSGSVQPSQDDITTTRRLEEAGKLLDIKLVDHIIVGAGTGKSYSFRANDMLKFGERPAPYNAGKVMEGGTEFMNENNTIEVLYVEPMKEPRLIQMEDNLESMQGLVGGMIEEYMPFEDDVAIVCNEEGKMSGDPLNRGIFGEDGQLQDIIAGPFFIAYAPIESEKFLSLPPELKDKYQEKFRKPERFYRDYDGGIIVKKTEPIAKEMSR